MLASTFGWIAIDPRTVRRVRRELDADEQGVVDEMGVGVLHSGYANRFFPGTSVLQTRARYVFFVAWNFLALRRATREKFDKLRREYERAVTARLIETYGKEDGRGIIGVRIAPKDPVQSLDFVYWTALQTWGLCSGTSRSSLLSRWDPRRVVRRDDRRFRSEEEIREELVAQFDVPPPPDRWPRASEPLSFELTTSEAEWLRERWLRIDPPCLLSECARSLDRKKPTARSVWDDGLARAAAERMDRAGAGAPALPSVTRALDNARGASCLAELVRATYAAFVEVECEKDLRAKGRSSGDASHHYRQLLETYFEDGEKGGLRETALEQSVDDLVGDLPEIASERRSLDVLLRLTQLSWQRGKGARDVLGDRSLRRAFEDAERKRKRSRARLAPIEGRERRVGFQKGTVSVSGLGYRWSVTKQLMLDVYGGLHGADE